ncbi:MAG: hypothetical protein DRQ42_06135 [Gammaproteobacteria bacterium]|nr:MAG: hypothetical protein DRQ42_06135 [Gammaproteobacteria bacterium]
MKIEFNPRNETEVLAVQKKVAEAVCKIQLNKAKKITTAALFERGGLSLNRAGINTLADAAKYTRLDFSKLKGIGPKVTNQISDELWKLNLDFAVPKRIAKKVTK